MCLSVIQSAREKSPMVSYHRKQIFPASDLANRSKLRLLGSGKSQRWDVSTPKTRTCKRCRFDRLSQMPDWNAGMPHLRVRRSGRRGVPGQTLERGQGRNQVAASIKEQNCDRQINKIYRDKMAPYLSSFYGTVRHCNSQNLPSRTPGKSERPGFLLFT